MKCSTHGKELVRDTQSDEYVCPVIDCEFKMSKEEYDSLFQNGE